MIEGREIPASELRGALNVARIKPYKEDFAIAEVGWTIDPRFYTRDGPILLISHPNRGRGIN
jgi:hypothetical protein